MSLRETDVIRAPQPSPPANRLCQSTDYGLRSAHTVPHGDTKSVKDADAAALVLRALTIIDPRVRGSAVQGANRVFFVTFVTFVVQETDD